MITETQQQGDYRKVYCQLEGLVSNCQDNLEQIFYERQHNLIEQLSKKAIWLKSQISRFKSLTSQQSVGKLIIKRKQEKQGSRLKLEMNWRQLTQKLKKMEEEQKKLSSENTESKFDVANLECKIKELQVENCDLQLQIERIKKIEVEKTKCVEMPKIKNKGEQKQLQLRQAKENKEIEQANITNNKYRQNISVSGKKENQCIKEKQRHRYNKKEAQTKLQNQLQQIRNLKQIPAQVLLQFLSRRPIKSQIFQILYH